MKNGKVIDLDANQVINGLTLKIGELTKQIVFLEVENSMLKLEMKNNTEQK